MSGTGTLRARRVQGGWSGLALLVGVLAACQNPVHSATAPSGAPAGKSSSMEDPHREGPRQVAWRVARSLDHCPAAVVTGAAAPVVQTLGSKADWGRYFAAQPRDVIDSDVAWNAERVLLVSLGHRPTSGWALAAAPEDPAANETQAWSVESKVLTVRVRSIPPEPGLMQLQVMTEPCLLVVLDGAGWQETRLMVVE